MSLLSAPRVPGALLAGALLVGCWTALQPAPVVPPFTPLGDQAVYDLQTPPASVAIEPLVHAPWRGSTFAVTSGVLAATLACAGMLVAVALGASPAAAVAIGAAVQVSPALAASVRHAAPDVIALLCVWTAWWVMWRHDDRSTRWTPHVRACAAALLIAIGGWWHWSAPLGIGAIVAGPAGPEYGGRRRWRALLAMGAAVAAIALYVWHQGAAATAASSAGLTYSPWDAWTAMQHDISRQGRVIFVGPDLASPWSWLAAALAGVGVAFHRWPKRIRPGIIITVALFILAGIGYPDYRGELVRTAAWMLAPVAAAGLSWVAAQAPAARRPLVTAGLAIVLLAAGLTAASRPLGIADARTFAREFEASLSALSTSADSAPVAIVAEDTLVDSAVAAFGPALERLPQDADAVAYAWRSTGTQVFAGPEARRHLEVLGLVFHGVRSIAEPAPFAWAAVVDRYHCAAIRGDRWSLLPGLEFTGRIGLQVPAGIVGDLRLIVGDTLPVALRAERPDGSPAPIEVETLLNGPSVNTPPPDYWFDGGDPHGAPGEIVGVTIAAHPAADQFLALHLGRRSPRVLARLRGMPSVVRGRVCAASLGVDRLLGSSGASEEHVPLDEAALFGTGWYGLEGGAADHFRWSAADAVVLVPLERGAAIRVSARASPAATAGDPAELMLTVNGIEQARVTMQPGATVYTWDVPARTWVTGVNDLHFHVSRTVRPADLGAGDRRVLGIALHALTLTR